MDPIFDGPSFTFRSLRPNLRRAQKLAREGVPATARVAGIRILRGDDDSPDHHEWALEVVRATGETFRAGCRQRRRAPASSEPPARCSPSAPSPISRSMP